MILFKLFGIIDVRPADILDVLLISIIIYYIFLLFRGTRAAQMIFGGLLLILAWIIAQWWELHTVVWLISNLATLGIIALVILFQPEIRSALTRIGQAASKLDFHNLRPRRNYQDHCQRRTGFGQDAHRCIDRA